MRYIINNIDINVEDIPDDYFQAVEIYITRKIIDVDILNQLLKMTYYSIHM